MFKLNVEEVRTMRECLKDLTVEVDHVYGEPRHVADAARTTISMENGDKVVTPQYMRKMYMCEHSPIRIMTYNVILKNVPYAYAMHLVRHNIGFTPYVSTQRDDRTEDARPRKDKGQEEYVMLRFIGNAQAIINISRKRLCTGASIETRLIWKAVLFEIAKYDKPLVDSCVPECVYRGFCPEFYPCKYSESKQYEEARNVYINFRKK